MAKELRAENIARMVNEPDWDNSDASSDEEDLSPLGLAVADPLQRAEESDDVDDEPQQPTLSTQFTDSGPNSSGIDQLRFEEPVGPVQDMHRTATALDFFNITFGNTVMDMLVQQTNLYAAQNPPASRYKWYDTCVSEMYLFLGIIVAMGVHVLPGFADYWSGDSLLGVPGITAGMPIDRFKVLLRCFHLNDNSTAVPRNQPGYDRLHKIRPLIERLRQTWRACYNPPREQSIDEAMVGFKGRNAMKQYMPMKPTKRGFKVWCRCSPNGLTNDCEVYEGSTGESRETSLSTAVVLQLAKYIYNKGHHLYFDNYFSSVDLAEELLRNNTYCCGTARSNRKKYPTTLKKVTLERGQHKSQLVGNVQCFVWKDRKNIDFLQTVCDPNTTTTVMRKNKDGTRTAVSCPLAVKLYNENMGGVDLADCKRQVYTCSRKAKKWWHRLFYFFLDVGIVNAHILETESSHSPNRTQKEFRLELARELMTLHTSRKRRARVSVESVPPSIRFCERHFADLLVTALNCRYCSTAENRKRTKYCCKQCNSKEPVPLCVVPCFRLYHTPQ
jgi:hypothetical protein